MRQGLHRLRVWGNLKDTAGIYFITWEKSNSAAMVSSGNLINLTDPNNAGIQSDYLVGTPCGATLRRITDIDPTNGARYIYLTQQKENPRPSVGDHPQAALGY